jgi:hypothetical protein
MNMEKSRTEILERDGWTRQFVASEPRLSEAVEVYEQAGFDVHLEPLQTVQGTIDACDSNGDGECRKCFEGIEHHCKIVFTRPKKDKKC